jgi:hypothetical protein
MKMDTKTKKPVKSTKQTIAKINSLLKGIDNSTAVLNKQRTNLVETVKEVRTLMGGLSNQVAQTPTKEVKKVALAKKVAIKAAPAAKKPAKKVEKAAPAKKATPAFKKPAKKVEKTEAPVVPAKKIVSTKVVQKSAEQDRPLLKDIIKQILTTSGPASSAVIWKSTKKFGSWSRQSVHNALRVGISSGVFSKHGEEFSLQNGMVNDDEAEKFVKQIENNQVVSTVQ